MDVQLMANRLARLKAEEAKAMKKVDRSTIDLLKWHFHKIARREQKDKRGSIAEVGGKGQDRDSGIRISTEHLEEICNRMVLASNEQAVSSPGGSDKDLVDLSLQYFDQGLGLHIV